MKKLLIILVCLFLSFEVKSNNEKTYLDFKRNEKQFHDQLLEDLSMMAYFGSDKKEFEDFISKKIQEGEIQDSRNDIKIKLKKKYSDSRKKVLKEILREKLLQNPRIIRGQFYHNDKEFLTELEVEIKKVFEEFSHSQKELINYTSSKLNSGKINNKKLMGNYNDMQKLNISKQLVEDFLKEKELKQRKENKKYYACMAKHANGQMEAYEVGKISESCKMVLSGDNIKQKKARCILKEIGKHSQVVLALKYQNCLYQYE